MENIISSLLNIKEQMEHSLQRFDALQQHFKDLQTSRNKMHQIFRQSIDEFEESFSQLEDRICEIQEEDAVAVEEKEAITLDPIIISQVSINAVGDPKPIPSSDCPLVLLSISTISMFPDSDQNQEISKGFLITLNLACLASAIRKDLVRKSAIAEEMCFMEGGLNEWPRLTWQPPWETYRAEKLTFSLFGVHQPKSTPLFPNRNQNRLHPPKPSAESLLETPILSYFFFEFCSNLLQEGHLCQQIHISKFLNRNQANKSLIPPSFRSRSNFFDPFSAELSLYLLSFGGSIAQQKAHNRGAAKGVIDALVFTAVRPQLLVEATKASNAIQLFKAALQLLKDLLELQPSVFKRRGEWAFLITGSEEWIYDWVVANCAFGILGGYSLQTTRIIELEAWALDEKDPFMRPEGGETTMSGFSFGGMDLWGYTSKGGTVRLARGTVAWELFDERHEGTLADESKNPIQRMDCNRVEALTGPKNAHDIPAANAYVQIRSFTWPGVLTSTGDTVDCRNNINQSPVTSISYKRRCSQTSKEEHETLSYEELQSLDDFELANVVIFGMVEGIFTEYKHPFAVTYLGTSLLAAYLPIAYIKDWLLKFLRSTSCTSDHDPADDFSGGIESPIYNNCAQTDMDIEQQQPLADEKCVKGLDFQKLEKPTIFYSKDDEHDQDMLIHHRKLSTKEVATLGLFIGPIWFLSEYFMNAALGRISVASTTILFSTSGLFVILIESMLGQASVNAVNLVSVAVSMAGVVMTTYGKTWVENESQSNTSLDRKHSFLGYVFALLSAMTDGLFTVLLKKFAGEGEKVDLQKLFGYIGLVILVSLWWLVLPLTALGIEPKFMVPDSATMVEVVVANCFAGSFLLDYFWALGVVWTTPLVAALGASLTIPLAMLEDMVIHGRHYSIIYILGSLQVFLGFGIANLSDWFSLTLGSPFLNSLRTFLIHS